MAALGEMPRGADADDAGAEDEGLHGGQCGGARRKPKAKLNFQPVHQDAL
jgi:hypothetical protein